jgi:hypothetical protein
MKLVKRLLVVVGAVVLLLVLAVGVAALYADSLAKAGIEKGGTYAMGVPTTLGSADVGLFSGTFAMHDLHVANPAGFKGDHFFRLGSGGVAADMSSVRKPVVEVPSLKLDGVRVNLERTASGSNYGVILENLKRFESGTPGTPVEKEASDAKKFVVRELVITDVEVRLDMLGLPGGVSAVTVPIHEIVMHNVGTAEGGLTAGQMTGVIVKAILATAAERGGSLFPSDVLGELKGGLAQLQGIGQFGVEVVGAAGEKAQKLAEGLTKIGGDAGDALRKGVEGVKEGAQDALKGIGDLIPGKKR